MNCRCLSLLSLAGVVLLPGISTHVSKAASLQRCVFEGFGTNFKLAVVTARSTDSYVLCAPEGGCRPSPLKSGEPIVVYRAEGDWTCAALPGGPGWVRSKDIQEVTPNPKPPLETWLGTWKGGAGRVTIGRTNAQTRLALEGSGTWEGGNGVVHTGRFSGEATPDGNRLHFAQTPCEIDLVLFGKYILADDNNACGGVNVRFSGVWKRTPNR